MPSVLTFLSLACMILFCLYYFVLLTVTDFFLPVLLLLLYTDICIHLCETLSVTLIFAALCAVNSLQF